MKIADILNVTLDELVGRTEATSEVVIQNPKLHQLYHEIGVCTPEFDPVSVQRSAVLTG